MNTTSTIVVLITRVKTEESVTILSIASNVLAHTERLVKSAKSTRTTATKEPVIMEELAWIKWEDSLVDVLLDL